MSAITHQQSFAWQKELLLMLARHGVLLYPEAHGAGGGSGVL
jgi:hypothetical protein